MIRTKKPYIIAADAHITAAKSKTWDYPMGHQFKTPQEVVDAIKSGKTSEEAYFYLISKYGTITGAVLLEMGHVSKSTESALRKGMKFIFFEK